MTDESKPTDAPEEGADVATVVMAPAQSTSESPVTGTRDWRDTLPKELRRAADKFGSPADVLKSYTMLERKLGRSVTIPADDASSAEIEAYYARLGRPNTPDGYEIRIPDDLPEHLRPPANSLDGRSAFLSAMHESGATPAVVQAAFDWYYGAIAAADLETRQAERTARAEAERALRTEWGPSYDRRIELAHRAATHFGGNDLIERFERAGLADDPICLRAFSAIGIALSEDGLMAGDAAPAADAQQRIDRIMKDHFGRPSYASRDVQNELRDLYQEVYGSHSA